MAPVSQVIGMVALVGLPSRTRENTQEESYHAFGEKWIN